MRIKTYLSLIRFHTPTGTLLLMFPSLWMLVLLSENPPDFVLSVAFALGAFLMRSSGCIINDLTDRKLDAGVERTKHRPLASGAISVWHAYAFLMVLLTSAAGLAYMLGTKVFIASLFVLPLIIVYPWMKRITFWPQLFLGITFNYGVILASVAVLGFVHPAAILVYLGSILWTLGYDTIYGYQDVADDVQMGIKSTARLFGDDPAFSLSAIYAGALTCWAAAGYVLDESWHYYVLLVFVAGHFIWQIRTLDISNAAICGKIFKSNAWLGGVMFLIITTVKLAS
jgi:4-hydroxybenzoate polyprenyltransferase